MKWRWFWFVSNSGLAGMNLGFIVADPHGRWVRIILGAGNAFAAYLNRPWRRR